MSIGRTFEFPAEQWAARRRMIRLCQLSCVLLVSGGVLLFLTTGNSQSMKTAWITDFLTILPPLSLLYALRLELRPPSRRFPFGQTRSTSIAYLVTAGTLTLMGVFLFVDSGLKLVHREHPSIGSMMLFGRELWAGWAMIAALFYSMCIGITIGRLKQPVAKVLYSKALTADATSNSAEWQSEGAAILGLLLVSFGLWWGDAMAALFISFEVIREGRLSIRLVTGDLMDESPTTREGDELESLPVRLRHAAEQIDWVERAAVRLREHGHAVTGEVFLVPRDADGRLSRGVEASDRLRALDWRLHDLVVMLVPSLDEVEPPLVTAVPPERADSARASGPRPASSPTRR
jgi:divalent metal cation (Fe/Co/Zn/Cd) transporter